MKRIPYLSLLLLFCAVRIHAQEVVLPLQMNAVLMQMEEEERGLKSFVPEYIEVDLDSNLNIIIDDFGYNAHVPNDHIWRGKSVFINRNFPIKPVTVGVATFDGLDATGYPYDFFSPTSFGPCDTLATLPIKMGNADTNQYDPVYLSFSYQPQGLNPNPTGSGDSIRLEFYQPYEVLYTIDFSKNPPDTVEIDSNFVDRWVRVWGQKGYDLVNTSCNGAFRSQTIPIPPEMYQDSFQFRFISFGNTSGNIDHWHLDFVVLSSDANAHNELGDYAFIEEIGSLINHYESMPWFHYVNNESTFNKNAQLTYQMRNTFGSNVSVDVEYRADDADGQQIDSITESTVPEIPAKTCLDFPLPFSNPKLFVFPSTSAPADSTTYFLKKTILRRRTGPVDLIPENNQVENYQVFGSYYAYDDGSAEAGYGLKSDNGQVAVKFWLPEGITDTLRSIYVHFNPVIFDRSTEVFRFTIWDSDNGLPGNIIYENTTVNSPSYPKKGVNHFTRYFLNDQVLVSDTFFVGYQKISGDVMNIGYDLNRKPQDKLFVDIGNGWTRSSVSPEGALMLRPSFRNVNEPLVGIKDVEKVTYDSELRIYPNPARDMVTIEIDGDIGHSWTAELYAPDGRMLRNIELQTRSELNVSDLKAGMYILRAANRISGEVVHGKILVLR